LPPSPSWRAGLPSRAAGACQCALNHREEELLAYLDEGLLYKEIENRLHLSHTALRKCQHRIYAKLGAQNRTEALNHWREKRLGETNPAIPDRGGAA
jgi:DNA-binding NarL/FixJ family response regulator